MHKNVPSGLRWLWVAVMVFVLDQATKFMAFTHLSPYDPYFVGPYFNFTLAFNRGAAFSFLNNGLGWQMWLFGILAVTVSVAILFRMAQMSYRQRWINIAFALIIGGALGNLFDRIYHGKVIDFIDLHVKHWHWPVFNIADSGICIGAVMLVIDVLFMRKA